MLDQPLVAEIVAFTLNHGVYETRTTTSVNEAKALLNEWQPHLAVLDMDIGDYKKGTDCESVRPAP
jgi:DNA-binding response OmpR family regulator